MHRLLSLEQYKIAWTHCCERHIISALNVTISVVLTKWLILNITEQKKISKILCMRKSDRIQIKITYSCQDKNYPRANLAAILTCGHSVFISLFGLPVRA